MARDPVRSRPTSATSSRSAQLVGEGHDQYVDDSFTSPNGRYLYVSRPIVRRRRRVRPEDGQDRLARAGRGQPRRPHGDLARRQRGCSCPPRRRARSTRSTPARARSRAASSRATSRTRTTTRRTARRSSTRRSAPSTRRPTTRRVRRRRRATAGSRSWTTGRSRSRSGSTWARSSREAGYPDQSSAVRPMAISPNERYFYFQVSFLHGFVEYDLKRDKVLRVKELPDRERRAARGVPARLRAPRPGDEPARDEAVRRGHDGRLRGDRRPQDASSTSSSTSARSPTGRRTRATAASASCRSRARTASSVISYRREREVRRIKVGDHPQRMRMGADPRDLPALGRESVRRVGDASRARTRCPRPRGRRA